MHRNHKVDYAQWQPLESGRRRNDLATNSYMPATSDPSLPGKWQLSFHKEQLMSLKNTEMSAEVDNEMLEEYADVVKADDNQGGDQGGDQGDY